MYYRRIKLACYLGLVTQAIVNNFLPLLLLTMQRSFGISLEQLSLLVSVNFGVQLLTDLTSPLYVDRLGYWPSMKLAQLLSAAGLLGLCLFTELFARPFAGLLVSVGIYAVGGGLLEVLVSPIIEACPSDNKGADMSLLHSFYCWGHVGVVLLSTAFFTLFGVDNWKVMALLWALIPLGNLIAFLRVPIAPLLAEGEKGMSLRQLCGKPLFWVLLLLMVCAGASEQAVSQWASTFAEKGLGVSKTLGDLMGPMLFAILMGTARAFYGKYGDRMRLQPFMVGSTLLCVGAYLLIGLTGQAWLGLVGCGLCGLSVGIMWPGAFSMAAKFLRGGGTALFALLALAGDLGCSAGPSLVGFVSGALGDELRLGILAGTVFPLLLLVGLFACQRMMAKKV